MVKVVNLINENLSVKLSSDDSEIVNVMLSRTLIYILPILTIDEHDLSYF